MFVNVCASLLTLRQSVANSGFSWDLVTMWHYLGLPGKTVVILLFVVFAWSVGVMIDRALTFGSARKQSHHL